MNIHVFGPVWAYWWLIFPAMWFVSRIVRMILRNSYERQRLQLLKTYLDQGKDIPDVLARDFHRY